MFTCVSIYFLLYNPLMFSVLCEFVIICCRCLPVLLCPVLPCRACPVKFVCLNFCYSNIAPDSRVARLCMCVNKIAVFSLFAAVCTGVCVCVCVRARELEVSVCMRA